MATDTPAEAAIASVPGGLIETDAVIIGAGPAGLFQVFELGLLDIRAHVVDSLPYPGGQCIELYPDKPIYDIPALLRCTGRELIDKLLQQIKPFEPVFHLGQEVSEVAVQADGRFQVGTSAGTRFLTRTVVIAGGVGSFQPRRLSVDGLAAFYGSQVFHHSAGPAGLAGLAGKALVIVGGDEAAVHWALHYAQPGPQQASSVLLIHRRDQFNAPADQLARLAELRAAKALQVLAGQVTGIDTRDGRLSGLQVTDANASTQPVALDNLLVCLGLSPKLGPIADWGLALERKQLVVNTETFATNVSGIFAVGDVNTYPGKKKLILSGFHEATLAAFGAAAIVFPEQRPLLQYTTTSPKLHRLLGV